VMTMVVTMVVTMATFRRAVTLFTTRVTHSV
jgi:hypothetical protein